MSRDTLRCVSCILLVVLVVFLTDVCCEEQGLDELKLLAITVATDETDGYKRFMRSAKSSNIDVKVLGMGEEWRGGDVKNYPGGGHKINILKKETELHKNESNLVLMFVDSYDVILLANPKEFLKKFLEFNANLVFSAEGFCWPDRWLKDQYPEVSHGKKYLCSGGFIGYASTFHQVVADHAIEDVEDDQLYYTKIFLDKQKRDQLKMKLDNKAEIFMNLNGAEEEVEIKFSGDKAWLENKEYGTQPLVAHGNGPSKLFLNYLDNYLPDKWNFRDGCTACAEDTISLDKLKEKEYPKILMGLFIEKPTPFIPEFLNRMMQLDYPKKRIDLLVHNMVSYHKPQIGEWLTDEIKDQFNSVTVLQPEDNVNEYQARNRAVEMCKEKKCDYLFSVDGSVVLTNKDTLKILIKQNRPVLAPIVTKHGKLWSNFWGALGNDGYYARSRDYLAIVQKQRKGVWNSPFITSIYLIQKQVLNKMQGSFGPSKLDPDMALCQYFRDRGIFMYATNLYDFGRLLETDNYNTNHLHNDLWEIFDNRLDWEEKYIHENYSGNLNYSVPIEEPCPDVYWFPIVTDTFAKHLIEEMEHFGDWSGGKHEDKRLSGGYENVPTDDIHMNQIGYERHWLHFLKEFIVPVNARLYPGYNSEARSVMNFVVKYDPNRQYYLRPHHDSSTYTINIALTRPGIDHGGGGCRFLRYNCQVTETRRGWSFMHPGRLTHYHEGLPVTWGKRYIMISFVDP
ncbi:procollagen-lysine,2-oxoglutarate 5-dioxygenase 3-like [Orbicella faveolata]|uniref:procollagen-lysine,2-oxoglutarate 5-dioxygenase 3-like n=1 Tax=Orbicella faveolata TaxID=48498 RepID=UPI0009E4D23D|nr:procollagen-lysine,2-oxoglutarate 5-dioxygenase 3-like [Orbicella faveolata]